jgi:hypothetical protein
MQRAFSFPDVFRFENGAEVSVICAAFPPAFPEITAPSHFNVHKPLGGCLQLTVAKLVKKNH